MSDDSLLADFLIEARELIASLDPALTELAEDHASNDAVNALFRIFHTVKGGAGFLDLQPLVRLCHVAEELVQGMRAGEVQVTDDTIDPLSAAVGLLESQLAALQEGLQPPEADASLLRALSDAVGSSELVDTAPAGTDSEPSVATDAETAQEEAAEPQLFVEDEEDLEALLDAAHGVSTSGASVAAPEPSAPAEAAGDVVGSGQNTASEERQASPSSAEADRARPPRTAEPVKKRPVEPTVRVDTTRLDAVMDLVGELVLVRNSLLSKPGSGHQDKKVAMLDRVTADLQAAVMRIRMQPLQPLFSRFPRIVRDLARSLGKELELEVLGAETELDKTVVEALSDPLVHLVRNAVDHGVELPQQRRLQSKNPTGRIRLEARTQGDHVLIRLEDDGAGMDPNKLRARAIDRGLLSGEMAATLDVQSCLQLIFMPGFSTRDEVSDVSGRGVGMDVVKTSIDALGGEIHLESEPGQGSAVELRLPLTLAIVPTLMVAVGPRYFNLPLSSVDEVLRLDESALGMLDGRPVLMVGEDPLPVYDLRHWAAQAADSPAPIDFGHAVIGRSSQDRFALIGGRVCGREEIVQKPLGRMLAGRGPFSGATLTGDGRIALIIDPAALLKSASLPPIRDTSTTTH